MRHAGLCGPGRPNEDAFEAPRMGRERGLTVLLLARIVEIAPPFAIIDRPNFDKIRHPSYIPQLIHAIAGQDKTPARGSKHLARNPLLLLLKKRI